MHHTRHTAVLSLIASLIFISLLAFPAQPVWADMAPPPPPEGANLFPDGEITEVRMEAETVDIRVVDTVANPDGLAQVSAEFHMRNLGTSDEKMQVRFPLSNYFTGKTPQGLTCYSAGYPTIQGFQVWVDGQPAKVSNTIQEVDNFGPNGGKVTIPCWANFPVVFAVGKEVMVKASYTVLPYDIGKTPNDYWGTIYFNYILRTGAGWKGTIGSADIRVHLPYAVTDENFLTASSTPPGAIIDGDTIRWQLNDFEPSDGPDVQVAVTRPSLWRKILKETTNTQSNPQDGEAWGRLGMAYKQTILERRGFRDDAAALQIFDKSDAAYRNAVTLKPKDADWHAGYAELLCWDAAWPHLHPPEETRDHLLGCLKEVQAALEINPRQANATVILNDWLQWIGNQNGTPVVDISQGTPIYTALTATPPLPTPIATVTQVMPITPTTTPQRRPSETSTSVPTATSTSIATATITPTPAAIAPTAAPRSAGPGLCNSALLFLPVMIFLWTARRKKIT